MPRRLKQGDLLTSHEVAELLGVAYDLVLELIARGELKSVRIGKRPRVHRDDLHDYVFGQSGARSGSDSAGDVLIESGEPR